MLKTQVYETTISKLQGRIALLGRILISLIFIVSAIMKIMDPSATTTEMAERGMTFVPAFFAAAVVIELVGGLALATGIAARFSAVVLFLYLIPVTVIFHNYLTDPSAQSILQLDMALKNVAIMGGLLMIAALGPGPYVIQADRLKLTTKIKVPDSVPTVLSTEEKTRKLEEAMHNLPPD
jgi:putative oxidoreductase